MLAKKALRKEMAQRLRQLATEEVAAQSGVVHRHLGGLSEFARAKAVSLYLPMDGGREVDTWPLLRQLLARGAKVFVPKVTGPGRGDMEMLRVTDADEAWAWPRTKWGIPEPSADMAAKMSRAGIPDLVLVPGVAFDSRCKRLGHGKGYYDTILQAQRDAAAERGLRRPTTVGLALSPQIVDEVPADDHDVRLDYVVSPSGPMAFTSEESSAAAAEQMSGAKRTRAEEDSAESAALTPGHPAAPSVEDRVDVAEGTFKYCCVRVSCPRRGQWLAVRSAPGSYHATVAQPLLERLRGEGLSAEPIGGGRIRLSRASRTAFIYGYSVGYGGDDGGPPGHGMADHSEVAALLRERYPDYDVSFSAEGY
eukprot:TRINITY_DN11318_c0_g1_i2.p1 TRINITY_DN11318_c0_g1~~TRINITY_DN11318_c0_g1_i2.p1  ORF type:complete len:393 (+),score=91.93 TRINITY_DN11318_c0_g1_i2:85-1179(+)